MNDCEGCVTKKLVFVILAFILCGSFLNGWSVYAAGKDDASQNVQIALNTATGNSNAADIAEIKQSLSLLVNNREKDKQDILDAISKLRN